MPSSRLFSLGWCQYNLPRQPFVVYSGRITAEIPQSGEVAQGSGLQARSITKSTAARF